MVACMCGVWVKRVEQQMHQQLDATLLIIALDALRTDEVLYGVMYQ